MVAIGATFAWAKPLEARDSPETIEQPAPVTVAPPQADAPPVVTYKPSIGQPAVDVPVRRSPPWRHKRTQAPTPVIIDELPTPAAALAPAPAVGIPSNSSVAAPVVGNKADTAGVVSSAVSPPVAAVPPAATHQPFISPPTEDPTKKMLPWRHKRTQVPTPVIIGEPSTPAVVVPSNSSVVDPVVENKADAAAMLPRAAPRANVETLNTLQSISDAVIIPNPTNLVQTVNIPQTAVAHAQPGTTFLSLCYHDVQDADPDQTYVGVTTAKLIEQFSWFRDNGFTPVSMDDILMARAGGKPLPENALLLTFDDGYVSFYTRVFPLLKAYNYPAVLAVVDSWIGKGGRAGDDVVDYAGKNMPSSAFLNWDQIREMSKSGLVEIASHTYASHKGIIANPQGNLEPAIVTRTYNKAAQRYENDAEYAQRLRSDFAAAARKIAHETGRAPRVMVWPYGQYNQFAIDAAREAGMTMTMTLDDGFGTVNDLTAIPRYLINADPDLQGFVVEMRDLKRAPLIRAAIVDLDLVYSADPERQLKNLDALIARVYAMKVSTVLLKGYAGYDDTGVTREVYFPNRHLPMRADLMNRVAWQLATRTGVKVYGVMPVLAYDFGAVGAPVLAWNPEQKRIELSAHLPKRISPFDPAGRQYVRDLYEDMGRAAPLDGVVFANDATLSEFEDASAPALAAYAAAGLPVALADIRANGDTMQKWTRLKTETLISFTRDLVNAARTYRAPLVTVRQSYAAPVFEEENEMKYAQEFGLFQKNYDYTAVLAMPLMENIGADDAGRWLDKLIGAVKQYPAGLQRSIFLLQTVDWRQPKDSSSRSIPEATIAAQMRQLTRSGAMNFSFTPDDFVRDQPRESALHGEFSLQTYPYRP